MGLKAKLWEKKQWVEQQRMKMITSESDKIQEACIEGTETLSHCAGST